MTADALIDVTRAFQLRMEAALGQRDSVYVGPPINGDVGTREAALFLFHIEPNRELRNTPRLRQVDIGTDTPALPAALDTLAVDLRFMITVFRRGGTGGNGVEPNELNTLGAIMTKLHAEPTLGGATLPRQEVRLSLEPYPMEEISRIWGLYPQPSFYRTSVIYLATPVFLEADLVARGRPVVSRRSDVGQFAEPLEASR